MHFNFIVQLFNDNKGTLILILKAVLYFLAGLASKVKFRPLRYTKAFYQKWSSVFKDELNPVPPSLSYQCRLRIIYTDVLSPEKKKKVGKRNVIAFIMAADIFGTSKSFRKNQYISVYLCLPASLHLIPIMPSSTFSSNVCTQNLWFDRM